MLVAAVLAVASTLPLGWLEAQPRASSDVAAIFAPWVGAGGAIERIARAGGATVRTGIAGNIVVAHGDDPAFADRLRAEGAWLIVDPVALGGCLAPAE